MLQSILNKYIYSQVPGQKLFVVPNYISDIISNYSQVVRMKAKTYIKWKKVS